MALTSPYRRRREYQLPTPSILNYKGTRRSSRPSLLNFFFCNYDYGGCGGGGGGGGGVTADGMTEAISQSRKCNLQLTVCHLTHYNYRICVWNSLLMANVFNVMFKTSWFRRRLFFS